MSVCENAIVEIKPTIEQLVNAIRPINGEDGTEEDILQNDINQSIRCTLCNKTFKNRGSALFHVKKTHSINISTNINLLLGINKKTNNLKYHFFCPVQSCKRISTIKYFLSTKLLIQHFQKTHYDKKLKCNFCTAKFALERDLRYHIKKICPKQKEFNKNIFKNCCNKVNGTIKKNTASQTEKWLVPTKIVLAGKFDKIYPKRKLTTEKHNYTQTELIYPQLQQEIQSSKIILNNNYQQNNNTINLINQQQYLNNNNIIFNNYQTVEESTQTAYCCCPPSSSFDFISEDIEREGESLLRNNGWTQTPPFYSFEPCNNNLMEMQSTSVQTDNTIIIPSIWNL